VGRFLEGRSLGDLNPDEVYVLARVLPDFGSEQRHQAYKGVVRDALAEGYVNGANSLEVLRRMRQELGISDDEHRLLLEELGVEDPTLLDPAQRRSLEDQVRLSGYRRSLERLLRLQRQLDGAEETVGTLACRFSISPAEEAEARETLDPATGAARRAELLLERLEPLQLTLRSLAGQDRQQDPRLVSLLEERLRHRHELCEEAIRRCVGLLPSPSDRDPLLERLHRLAPDSPPGEGRPAPSRELTLQQLERLVDDPDPGVASAALVLLSGLDPQRGRACGDPLLSPSQPAWVRRTVEQLRSLPPPPALAALPDLEKRVVLATSDFFHRTWADTLDVLADHADIRCYEAGAAITEAGDTCRELLLLIDGSARVEVRDAEGLRVHLMQPGQVLDELEVLSHGTTENTIVAETSGTRVLAVPVDCFDSTLERDPEFARRVLALESRQLQRITRRVASAT
jgi:CRP-like cAMP-binding protein